MRVVLAFGLCFSASAARTHVGDRSLSQVVDKLGNSSSETDFSSPPLDPLKINPGDACPAFNKENIPLTKVTNMLCGSCGESGIYGQLKCKGTTKVAVLGTVGTLGKVWAHCTCRIPGGTEHKGLPEHCEHPEAQPKLEDDTEGICLPAYGDAGAVCDGEWRRCKGNLECKEGTCRLPGGSDHHGKPEHCVYPEHTYENICLPARFYAGGPCGDKWKKCFSQYDVCSGNICKKSCRIFADAGQSDPDFQFSAIMCPECEHPDGTPDPNICLDPSTCKRLAGAYRCSDGTYY